MRRQTYTLVVLALCCILSIPVAAATVVPHDPTTGLFNTGEVANSDGTDAYWRLINNPYEGELNKAYIVNTGTAFPWSFWVANHSDSKWIGPQADEVTDQELMDYTYELTFNLTGYIPDSARLSVEWASDNCPADVVLNSTHVTPNYVSGHCLLDWHSGVNALLLTTGFIPGLNTFQFNVQNWAGTFDNPTGLQARLSLMAEEVPEPASGALLAFGLLAAAVCRRRR